MTISLNQILALVGRLDDSPGEETPRERFRNYLSKNVRDIGQLRDYVEECLRGSGEQYNRALQDLVNHVGRFLGFEVTFGRYQGVQGQIGFDGHWKSPTGFSIVIEVKTTEAYAVRTATLVGYVDQLISEKAVPSWDTALGLYVVGRPDPEIRQLENAILAERRTDQLRIISVTALLLMAEMMNEYDLSHEDVLAVLRPSGPAIDPVVNLMARLVAERRTERLSPSRIVSAEATEPAMARAETVCWLTPVKSDKAQTAEDCIRSLVGEEAIYAFGDRTPGRKHLKPGDWVCFYAVGKGVIAHARVVSSPEKGPHPKVRNPELYPWVFGVGEACLYLNNPVVIDGALREQLDAFRDRDPEGPWAWFVQATHRLAVRDFELLTRRAEK
ncbi:MAG: EVE domain-containing protein [Chloroflexi bacterium]|nr:EVE domain-containing protein [Chloroflexota bacterium]